MSEAWVLFWLETAAVVVLTALSVWLGPQLGCVLAWWVWLIIWALVVYVGVTVVVVETSGGD